MIRIERDPAFWMKVANHPAVGEAVLRGAPLEMAGMMAMSPDVLPLAAEHGGFLFRAIDGLGMVLELHTLFTPEGWGREVLLASYEAFAKAFETAQLVVTQEQERFWRSRPPKSQGWKAASETYAQTDAGPMRMWVLTRDNWLSSPAIRRRG